MHQTQPLSFDGVLAGLKAAGEETRLRILALLAHSELTVKDLTAILGQSQPRISRHLKLLVEAGLVGRNPEGAWVFYRLSDEDSVGQLAQHLLGLVDDADPLPARDRERLTMVKRHQAAAAEEYFAANAADWDTIRALHVADDAVEKAVLEAVGSRPFESLLDLGTGTGRMLELLAPLYNRGVGVDTSTDMLAVARAKLGRAGIGHAQIRLGDIRNLPFARDTYDLVTIHQVLHFLDDPERAIAEAARVLRPGGRLLVVDFARHDLEFLRVEHAHRRLGIGGRAMAKWVAGAELDLVDERELSGSGDETRLTVSLWLARDRRVAMADRDSAGSLEVA